MLANSLFNRLHSQRVLSNKRCFSNFKSESLHKAFSCRDKVPCFFGQRCFTLNRMSGRHFSFKLNGFKLNIGSKNFCYHRNNKYVTKPIWSNFSINSRSPFHTSNNYYQNTHLNVKKTIGKLQEHSLVFNPIRKFFKGDYKDTLQKVAEKAKETTQNISSNANKILTDKEKYEETTKNAANWLKKVGKSAVSATQTTVSSAKDLINKQKPSSDSTKTEETQSNTKFFGNTADTKTIAGKVTFVGRILAFFGRMFTKVTLWVTTKLFSSVFGKSSIFKSKLMKYVKDTILTKVMLFFGCIIGIYMGYKAIISYFKSRRFRKQDKELEEIKIELKRLKEDLDNEIKKYKK